MSLEAAPNSCVSHASVGEPMGTPKQISSAPKCRRLRSGESCKPPAICTAGLYRARRLLPTLGRSSSY